MSETDLANVFHTAADAGDVNKLRECLESVGNAVDVNCCNKKNYTALHKACSKGHLECVRYLSEKDANVNAHADGKISPLHLATEGGHAEIVKALIEKGSDVNQCTSRGNDTPLHWLIKNKPPGKPKVVEKEEILNILHDNGAKLDLQSDEGSTALHLACLHEEYGNIFKRLVELGAKTNIKDKDSMTCIELARFHQRSFCSVSENVVPADGPRDTAAGQGQHGILVEEVLRRCSLSDASQSPGDVEADGAPGQNRTQESQSTRGDVSPHSTEGRAASPTVHQNVTVNVNVNVGDGGVVNVGDNTSVNTSPTCTPNILQLELDNDLKVRQLEKM